MSRAGWRNIAWVVGVALFALVVQLAALMVPFSRAIPFVLTLVLVVAPLVVVTWLMFIRWVMMERERHLQRRKLSLHRTALLLVFLLSSVGWSLLHVPHRLCLAASREALMEAAASAELASQTRSTSMQPPQRLGCLPVERVVKNDDGAVYYVLNQYSVFIDRITEGLVYNLTDSCTPFGGARFSSTDLGEGWHRFRVSNDWHC